MRSWYANTNIKSPPNISPLEYKPPKKCLRTSISPELIFGILWYLHYLQCITADVSIKRYVLHNKGKLRWFRQKFSHYFARLANNRPWIITPSRGLNAIFHLHFSPTKTCAWHALAKRPHRVELEHFQKWSLRPTFKRSWSDFYTEIQGFQQYNECGNDNMNFHTIMLLNLVDPWNVHTGRWMFLSHRSEVRVSLQPLHLT